MRNFGIGRKIRKLRQEMKLSQKDFSQLVGIPQPSLSAYEHGRVVPPLRVLYKLAEKCNVSMNWLCDISMQNSFIADTGYIGHMFASLLETEGLHIHVDKITDTNDDGYLKEVAIRINALDETHPLNNELCHILKDVSDNYEDLMSYTISKEIYELVKTKIKKEYDTPLFKKEIQNLSRQKRKEFLLSSIKNNQ